MSEPRVLVVHNRYRRRGGEERAVELQVEALRAAGVPCRSLERDSGGVGRRRAGAALLRGGEDPDEVERAARELRATVVHVHNMHPLFGHRALQGGRRAGAAVVLHLHNFRLFCAIAVAWRDGEVCFRCRGRLTLPGVALNCRGSAPEAAAYAAGLALHQPAVLDAVDRFVTPGAHAAGQLDSLGLPRDRVDVIPNYVPESELVERSLAAGGEYALYAGRLAPEKGVDIAIRAAALAGIPLKVAGEGELENELRGLVRSLDAQVELLGRVPGTQLRELRRRAAMVVVPSLWAEVFPYAALDSMAAGVPVVGSRTGGLPEMIGDAACVPRGSAEALAAAMSTLWRDPDGRRAEGDRLIARARERFGEAAYVEALRDLYRRTSRGIPAQA